MSTEKKWMAVMVEVETYDGEVQSVLPIEAETNGFLSQEELEGIHKFLREDDDASFDFMWDLRSVVRASIEELDT